MNRFRVQMLLFWLISISSVYATDISNESLAKVRIFTKGAELNIQADTVVIMNGSTFGKFRSYESAVRKNKPEFGLLQNAWNDMLRLDSARIYQSDSICNVLRAAFDSVSTESAKIAKESSDKLLEINNDLAVAKSALAEAKLSASRIEKDVKSKIWVNTIFTTLTGLIGVVILTVVVTK